MLCKWYINGRFHLCTTKWFSTDWGWLCSIILWLNIFHDLKSSSAWYKKKSIFIQPSWIKISKFHIYIQISPPVGFASVSYDTPKCFCGAFTGYFHWRWNCSNSRSPVKMMLLQELSMKNVFYNFLHKH